MKLLDVIKDKYGTLSIEREKGDHYFGIEVTKKITL